MNKNKPNRNSIRKCCDTLYCEKCGFYAESYDAECSNCKEIRKPLLKFTNLKGGKKKK